jgi:hypothetical protein
MAKTPDRNNLQEMKDWFLVNFSSWFLGCVCMNTSWWWKCLTEAVLHSLVDRKQAMRQVGTRKKIPLKDPIPVTYLLQLGSTSQIFCNLPKQCHQLGTKSLKHEPMWGYFRFKPLHEATIWAISPGLFSILLHHSPFEFPYFFLTTSGFSSITHFLLQDFYSFSVLGQLQFSFSIQYFTISFHLLWTESLYPIKFICWNPNFKCSCIWRWGF